MATWDNRSTQKIISLAPNITNDNADKIKDMEVRMKSIEQSVNLILKKLDRIEKSNNTEIA